MPDSLECHIVSQDSVASIANTAPDIAPMPAPLSRPLSVAIPITPPVIVEPTAHSDSTSMSEK